MLGSQQQQQHQHHQQHPIAVSMVPRPSNEPAATSASTVFATPVAPFRPTAMAAPAFATPVARFTPAATAATAAPPAPQ
eukprot:277787-Lingulodinium_polyedra.AAC.1